MTCFLTASAIASMSVSFRDSVKLEARRLLAADPENFDEVPTTPPERLNQQSPLGQGQRETERPPVEDDDFDFLLAPRPIVSPDSDLDGETIGQNLESAASRLSPQATGPQPEPATNLLSALKADVTKSKDADGTKAGPTTSLPSQDADAMKPEPTSRFKKKTDEAKAEPTTSLPSQDAGAMKPEPTSSLPSKHSDEAKAEPTTSLPSQDAGAMKPEPTSSLPSKDSDGAKAEHTTSLPMKPEPTSSLPSMAADATKAGPTKPERVDTSDTFHATSEEEAPPEKKQPSAKKKPAAKKLEADAVMKRPAAAKSASSAVPKKKAAAAEEPGDDAEAKAFYRTRSVMF